MNMVGRTTNATKMNDGVSNYLWEFDRERRSDVIDCVKIGRVKSMKLNPSKK